MTLLRQIISTFALAYASLSLAGAAAALEITVEGQVYDIRYFDDSESFNDNRAVLTNTDCSGGQACAPWWGLTQSEAGTEWRDVYWNTHGLNDPPLTDGLAYILNFGYEVIVFGEDDERIRSEGLRNFSPVQVSDIRSSVDPRQGVFFAYAVLVPEINASAFTQGLFVIFALLGWVTMRRARSEPAS
ncbi:hypothetical protein HKCCSP123_11395 [Rhodobacterales bacterium HKCCSP123]|nr:hypothetical protein [Rhodobacterales bacterium HKCCSP123]